jgi:hypothetical protein
VRPDWLSALLAGVIALAALAAPPMHARMVWDGMVEHHLYAMPDGTLPDICPGGDNLAHSRHIAPPCDACVLVAAPGILPAPAFAAQRTARVRTTLRRPSGPAFRAGRIRHTQRARGPPPRA